MKILKKVWGISLALILVASMFLMVAPVSAASLAWSTQTIPSGLFNQLAAGTSVANVTVAPNGDIFVIDSNTGNRIYKSVDGGIKWTVSTIAGATRLIDLAVSPAYATDNRVFALDAGTVNAQAYISSNGGVSFAVLGGTAAGVGTSIAVAPNYSAGNGEVMVGTMTDVYIWGKGGVQNWNNTITIGGGKDVLAVAFSPNFPIDQTRVAVVHDGANIDVENLIGSDGTWNATLGGGAPELVAAGIAVSNASIAFPSDFNTTMPQTRVLYVAVDSAINRIYRVQLDGNATANPSINPAAGFSSSSIAYSGTTAAGTLFAGEFTDDSVWKTSNPTAVPANSVVWLENYGAPTGGSAGPTYVALANDYATSNKVYAGTAGLNSAFNVSVDGGAYFYQAGLIDTAIAGINDFQAASTSEMYMFTNSGVPVPAEALVITVTTAFDGGAASPITFTVTFRNQNNVITTGIITLAENQGLGVAAGAFVPTVGGDTVMDIINVVQTTSATEVNGAFDIDGATTIGLGDWALVAGVETFTDGVTVGTGIATSTDDSLWKTSDAGATWYRVLSIVAGTNTALIRVSPNYATDNTVIYGDIGATAIRMSNDGGKTWVPRTSPFNIADIALKDGNTFYVGSSAATQTNATLNGGWTWQPAATNVTGGTGVVSDIKVDLATGHILVGCTGNGMVSLSTNGNSTYTALAANFAGANAVVAFDGSYADNNIVYVASLTAGVVERIHVSAVSQKIAITPVAGATPNIVDALPVAYGATGAGDLIVAPDGTLYISDTTIATPDMYRSINPAAGTATISGVEWNQVDATAGAGVILGGMSLVEGSNVIFAIDTATPSIKTYTDILSVSPVTVTAPEDGVMMNRALINTTVQAVDGARNYEVQWHTRPDFVGAGGDTIAIAFPALTSIFWADSATVPATGIPQGVTLYYRARVTTPVLGPWSDTYTVETHLPAAVSTAPGIVGQQGGEGSTAAGGWGVGLTPIFQWGAIGNATAYEFKLSSDAAMSDLVIDATGSNALGVVTAFRSPVELDYNTTYFWQVRAISATSTTDWSPVTAFTTMEEVVPTATGPTATGGTGVTVITTQAPDVTQTVEKIAPAYIWAIIAVGAILVIAVIILIVRTRRTV